ncbi:MAG: hydroxyisourate hydrolase [Bdellovibrionota bacterium]
MNNRSPITTHVLDTSRGKAAAGVPVLLEKQEGSTWRTIRSAATNADGRVEDLLPAGSRVDAGTYRLSFDTKSYFAAVKSFYPSVTVIFEINQPLEHYHVPLLLSPFGFSTYRGT